MNDLETYLWQLVAISMANHFLEKKDKEKKKQ